MKTQYTITDAIVASNWDADEIGQAFRIEALDVKTIMTENNQKLTDESVSEEEYQEWCDTIDAENGTAELE